MRLPTELRQDGWNLLPRPHHLRAHPGPHNMAEGHQGWSRRPTNKLKLIWNLTNPDALSTHCSIARPSWSRQRRSYSPTTIINKCTKSRSSGNMRNHSTFSWCWDSLLRLQSELFFINKKNKYVWDETVQLFRKLRNIDEGLNQSDFFKMQVELGRYCLWVPRYQYIISQGLSSSEVRARILEYGENFIKISVPPVLHLVIHEGLNPFFLFQGSPQPQDFEFCRTFDISCFIPSN